jgi:glycosyltransferase involved in cell wall biosynthesis
MRAAMKLVIQIPCLNETSTLPGVLADLPATLPGIDSIETLVIDDGSTDGTAELAKSLGVTRVVRHRGNRGLARAFLSGLEAALEMGADVIVNTDGDHQYPGSCIGALVEPIVSKQAELVIGDRKPMQDARVPAIKKLFYWIGSYVVRTTSGVSVHDAPSGFRAMSREFALSVYLTNPFSYTLETIFAAAEQRYPIREVEIRSNPVTRQSRLFTNIGVYMQRSASIIMQGYSMHNPLRAFGWLSMPFLLLGLILGVRFIYFFVLDPDYSGHIQSLILAAIAIVVGAQILIFGMLGSLVRANRLLLQDIRMRVRRLELREDASRSASSVERVGR